MAKVKYAGARNASIVDKKGVKHVIAPNTVFGVEIARVNATLNLYGVNVISDAASVKALVKKCTPSTLKLTAKNPLAASTAKPTAPTKVNVAQPKTVKPAEAKPSTPPKPAAASPDFKWFKYNGTRAKSFVTPRGKKVVFKSGTLFGLSDGKKATAVFVPDQAAKFNVADAAAEGLRKAAAAYRGKVPGLDAQPTAAPKAVKVPTNESGLYFEDNRKVQPSAAKVKVSAAELKEMLGAAKLPFTGPIAKIVMKRAFDKNVLDDMKRYLQRQAKFLECPDSVQSLIVKWKPEGRFLPTGGQIVVDLSDSDTAPRTQSDPRVTPVNARPSRQPKINYEDHGFQHLNTPGVEIRPRPNKTPIIVNLDEEEDWGDNQFDDLAPTDDDLRRGGNSYLLEDNLLDDSDDLDDIDQSILDRLDDIESSSLSSAEVKSIVFVNLGTTVKIG